MKYLIFILIGYPLLGQAQNIGVSKESPYVSQVPIVDHQKNVTDDPNNDGQLQYQEKKYEPQYTPESPMYYIRSGYSVGTLNGLQSSMSLGAVGYRRYADEFYYGFEFNSHSNNASMRQTGYEFLLGYHLLTVRYRIKPYAGVVFGYNQVQDIGGQGRPEAQGIGLGADVGAEFLHMGPVVLSAGLRYESTMLNNPAAPTPSFLDLYLLFGVRF